MESKECVVCGKQYDRDIMIYQGIRKSKTKFQPKGVKYKFQKSISKWNAQKYCSVKCSTQRFKVERYSLLDHVKFFRETGMVYTDWELIPKDWYPKGIRRKAQEVKWTLKEIKEFREWNQKNA